MSKEINWPSWMLSSTGEGLSLRIKGYLTEAIPLIVFVSKLLGHPIIEADIETVSSAVTLLIASVWGIFGGVMIIGGWAVRNFNKQNRLGVFNPNHPKFAGRE